jgi:hypothetical protein
VEAPTPDRDDIVTFPLGHGAAIIETAEIFGFAFDHRPLAVISAGSMIIRGDDEGDLPAKSISRQVALVAG